MTFWPECGADKSICISSISNSPTPHDGFIMIPCMSDLVEEEIQRLGASLNFLGQSNDKDRNIFWKDFTTHTMGLCAEFRGLLLPVLCDSFV